MLSGAQRLKGEGKDVVIGLVETHGRPETAALLSGLEVMPRKSSSHRGHVLHDFDLDAALIRKPALIVIDELAHSNPPDARHPKRYQDVQELIDAGIDVWTALNIQHIESLSDVVSTITGIKVRELVPDTVLEFADDVVLVDITPDELIQRLKQGKVYLPDNARRAADNFLQAGNITALRELALRRTAQRVDDQMVDYLRQRAIEGPWPSAERIMVCVGGDDMAEQVVRASARMATGLNASWLAVHITSVNLVSDPARLKLVDDALALAERLGAEISRHTSSDLATEVIRLARRENITQVIIGRTEPGLLKRLAGRSLPDAILRQAHGIAVHVLTREAGAARTILRRPRFDRAGLVLAPVAVAAATLAGWSISHLVELPNLSMVFLAAVLFCAVTYGTWSAVTASVLSFLSYNYFFIEPRFTLTVAKPHELLALCIFLLVAVLTGSLAGRVREQSLAALARVRQVQSLLDLSRKLSATVQPDDVLWVVATQAAAIVQGQSIILMRQADDLQIVASMPPEDTLGAADWGAARWAADHSEAAGWRTGTLPNATFQFHPLKTPRGAIGAVGLRPGAAELPEDMRRMVDALIDQASIALERTRLAGEASEARASAEGEKLRSALLSSVSHDLRTPLSSIIGSVTALRKLGRKMPAADRDDLLVNIEEEATRLSRFVTNLLDMTRLESSGVNARLENCDLVEIAAATLRRAREYLPHRKITAKLSSEAAPVLGDAALIEQLIFNLIENADKYSDRGLPVGVSVECKADHALIAVEDEGPGIPQADLEKVFEKFYRIREGDGRPAGTGLGLAICRAIALVMDGTIHAESPVIAGHGTRFVFQLPMVNQP